jgi:hypothetical protein
MKPTHCPRNPVILPAILSLMFLGLPALPADRASDGGGKLFATGQDVVELGSADFAATTALPAAAGGNVSVTVRVTLRTSRPVVAALNEGISSGKYRPPYWANKEFTSLILDSKPGCFEVEFLWLNKESRFYYFFEEELKKIKSHPSIPADLKSETNELTRKAKALLYQTIRPNDYQGSKILFEQDASSARIEFFGSDKRGNSLVGKLVFGGKEMPIFDAMKKVLSEEHKPTNPSITTKEKGSFEDIITSAQKKHVLTSKN